MKTYPAFLSWIQLIIQLPGKIKLLVFCSMANCVLKF